MRVVFATSELAPLVRVGGLAYAAAGLAQALHDAGVDVTVVLPDYLTYEAGLGPSEPLAVPDWIGPVTLRRGTTGRGVPLIAIHTPGIDRPHPYTDKLGRGWADNDRRFLSFSAAIAALADQLRPDVLHLNDWHTAATLGFSSHPPPSVLTIHNLAYQGVSGGEWLDLMVRRPDAYEWFGGTNPLSGAIALADLVITVSPNYADEITTEAMGSGLHDALAARGDRLVGVLNGIDTSEWSPAEDRALVASYGPDDTSGKARNKSALVGELGWASERFPLIGMVTRLVDQKGVDLALQVIPFLGRMPARLVMLGSGSADLAERADALAARFPEQFRFVNGFDEALAHRIFAGSDLYLMPSRFEPCGLAQMQAMSYGAIPIVTDVGGLHDTVIDADDDPDQGTGYVASEASAMAILDATHRAVRGWRATKTRRMLRQRGMRIDWSWRQPAIRQVALYTSILGTRRGAVRSV